MYKRVLLKISGEALMGESGPIGFEKVEKTARSIAALAEKGIEVGVVVGGGNIIRGRDACWPPPSTRWRSRTPSKAWARRRPSCPPWTWTGSATAFPAAAPRSS